MQVTLASDAPGPGEPNQDWAGTTSTGSAVLVAAADEQLGGRLLTLAPETPLPETVGLLRSNGTTLDYLVRGRVKLIVDDGPEPSVLSGEGQVTAASFVVLCSAGAAAVV